MKGYLALAGLALFLSAGNVFAQTETQSTYQCLASASCFSVGHVGRGGGISLSEQALWKLIQTKDEKSLLVLTKERNPAARMYALLGLRYLESRSYKAVANSLRQSSVNVKMQSGCIAYEENIKKTTSQIRQGYYSERLKYDMENRKQ